MIKYFYFNGEFSQLKQDIGKMMAERKQQYPNLNVIDSWPQYCITGISDPDYEVLFHVGKRKTIQEFTNSDSSENIRASEFLTRYLPKNLWGYLSPAGYIDYNDECVLISELYSRDKTGKEAVIDVFSLKIGIVCHRNLLRDAGWDYREF
jgi:hypothetical protein